MKKILIILALITTPAFALAGTIERISIPAPEFVIPGEVGNDSSEYISISADGRYVSFWSSATNLVEGDTNAKGDIFVYDRQTGLTERVSVDGSGGEANNYSYAPSISSDGRYVAFDSSATNLVEGDTNAKNDIFVHDRQTGTTERVSVDSAGVQADNASEYPSISSDGRYVAFVSSATNLVEGDTNAARDIFVHDRQTGVTERVNVDSLGGQGNNTGGFAYASISSDGRYVVFDSNATNLVEGDTNAKGDVFVRDRQTGTTERVSVDSAGGQADGGSNIIQALSSISSDGRYVVFESGATNLVDGDTNGEQDIFVHDRQTGTTERVNVDASGAQSGYAYWPVISSDGGFVAFTSDSNLVEGVINPTYSIFVRDLTLGTNELVSRASGTPSGSEGDARSQYPGISDDGRYVVFQSDADNLVENDTNTRTDVFLHDTETGTVAAVSDVAVLGGSSPAISALGEYVAYTATGIGGINLYLYSADTEETVALTSGCTGLGKSCAAYTPDVSEDGQYIAFSYRYQNTLLEIDEWHVYVYDRVAETEEEVSVNDSGSLGGAASTDPSISSDGRYVAFSSLAGNLFEFDTNDTQDIFLRDRTEGTTILVSVDESGVQLPSASYYPSISPSGRHISFVSDHDSDNQYDLFIYDGESGTTHRVPSEETDALYAGVYGFSSHAFDDGSAIFSVYIDEDTYVRMYYYDFTEGTFELLSEDSEGVAGDGYSWDPAASSDARYVAFASDATNLVAGDTNGVEDIFLVDRGEPQQEEPPAGDDDDDDDGGGGGISSRHRSVTPTPTVPATQEELVKSILEQLILVLQQLIQALLAQQQQQ